MAALDFEARGSSAGQALALVTGASGCVGRAVVAVLRGRGWRVRSLVRTRSDQADALVEEFVGDLADAASLAGACRGVDLVVHAAAVVGGGRQGPQIWAVNRDGTAALCEEALRAGVRRFLYVSTADVFGFDAGGVIGEDSPKRCPRAAYSRSKLAGEQVVWAFRRRGLPVTVVYPVRVFGPGDRHLVPELLAGLESGRLVHVDGGRAPLELAFSGNVAEAIVLAATAPRAEGQRYILGDGFGVTTGVFVDRLAEQAGRMPPAWSVPGWAAVALAGVCEAAFWVLRRRGRPLLTRYAVRSVAGGRRYDTARIRALGWEPGVDLQEAVRRTVDDLAPPPAVRVLPAGLPAWAPGA